MSFSWLMDTCPIFHWLLALAAPNDWNGLSESKERSSARTANFVVVALTMHIPHWKTAWPSPSHHNRTLAWFLCALLWYSPCTIQWWMRHCVSFRSVISTPESEWNLVQVHRMRKQEERNKETDVECRAITLSLLFYSLSSPPLMWIFPTLSLSQLLSLSLSLSLSLLFHWTTLYQQLLGYSLALSHIFLCFHLGWRNSFLCGSAVSVALHIISLCIIFPALYASSPFSPMHFLSYIVDLII